MKHTITALFLAPLLDLRDGAPVNTYDPAYYLDTYSGDAHNEQYKDWLLGDYVLLEYTNNIPQSLIDYLQGKPSFVEQYSPQKGKEMFVFQLPKELKDTYISKILEGKYSEADRDTVDKYFPDNPNHARYGNRLIFDKSDLWRNEWENKIGISLPEGAEVYSRPLPKNELYGYINDNQTVTDSIGEQRTLIVPVL